ncbi:hypothetical protein CIW54_27985 (plasmid) [Paraburkholderia sp. T12-10]|nr:hypothetical protein CIW54_27985 [Paraburkholderia sp. T12-10]
MSAPCRAHKGKQGPRGPCFFWPTGSETESELAAGFFELQFGRRRRRRREPRPTPFATDALARFGIDHAPALG